MELQLAQVRTAIEARSAGTFADQRVRGWNIDSRTTRTGDLFFAIKGDRHDGHAFAGRAIEQGAVAAVVSQPVAGAGTLLEVKDTIVALQKLARSARKQWGRPIVAVTGSAGKTTTKDIIAQLLSARFRVGKTPGNLNNHIGLPLSILRIPDDADIAVIELGMNHSGEIRELTAIVEPEIGVVTNVGFAHMEGFE